jgi:hypothetical protein
MHYSFHLVNVRLNYNDDKNDGELTDPKSKNRILLIIIRTIVLILEIKKELSWYDFFQF